MKLPRRFSIAGLMVVVLVCLVGFAALHSGSATWAGGLYLLTYGVLTLAVVGAVCRGASERAWWLGFALFGLGYWRLHVLVPLLCIYHTPDRCAARMLSGLTESNQSPARPLQPLLLDCRALPLEPPGRDDRGRRCPRPSSPRRRALRLTVMPGLDGRAGRPGRGGAGLPPSDWRGSSRSRLGAGRVQVGPGPLGGRGVPADVGFARLRGPRVRMPPGSATHDLVRGGPLRPRLHGPEPRSGSVRGAQLCTPRRGRVPDGSPPVAAGDRERISRRRRPASPPGMSESSGPSLGRSPCPSPTRPRSKTSSNYIRAATRDPEGREVTIYVDPVGLKEAEKTMKSPIQIDLAGLPLSTTLRLALKQLGLVYRVRDGLLYHHLRILRGRSRHRSITTCSWGIASWPCSRPASALVGAPCRRPRSRAVLLNRASELARCPASTDPVIRSSPPFGPRRSRLP